MSGRFFFIEQTAPVKTLRFFDEESRLILTKAEAEEQWAKAEGRRAKTEAQRVAAEAEARRAAEAEVARLKALLEKKD